MTVAPGRRGSGTGGAGARRSGKGVLRRLCAARPARPPSRLKAISAGRRRASENGRSLAADGCRTARPEHARSSAGARPPGAGALSRLCNRAAGGVRRVAPGRAAYNVRFRGADGNIVPGSERDAGELRSAGPGRSAMCCARRTAGRSRSSASRLTRSIYTTGGTDLFFQPVPVIRISGAALHAAVPPAIGSKQPIPRSCFGSLAGRMTAAARALLWLSGRVTVAAKRCRGKDIG